MSDTLKKYTITIQRNQIAEAEIEVEAETQGEAEELALNKAEDCEAKFEEVDYNFDIIHIETDEEDEDEA
jgi:hypothetical protein